MKKNCIFRGFSCFPLAAALFSSSLIFLLSSLSSCTSLRQPKDVFVFQEYTEKDIIENEKKRISALKDEHPVEALWRAEILGDEETVKLYEENLFSLFTSALSSGDFEKAWKYYVSLESCGSGLLKNVAATRNSVYADFVKNVPSFNLSSDDLKLLPKSMADCVNATVTIWVDKGIKIQNGVGYADRSLGSGFFINKDGYIVTNHHVISELVDPKYEGYARVYVKLARDQENRIPAKVVGYDETLDLALLKAEVSPPFILALGSSLDLSVGDRVSAIGTPLGLHGTVTTGIVSAVGRKLFTTGSVMQIDAAVNSGNSGGPLIDSNMRVQAIVFAGIMQYQGLNFAIPVEYLKQDLPFLFAGGKRKQVWVGAYGHTKREGLSEKGLEVQYIMPGGVLSRAGLKKGDLIYSVDGNRINGIERFQDILRNFSDETILRFSYERDGEKKDGLFYLAERPENPGYEIYSSDLIQHSFVPIFGMGLTPSSTTSSRRYTVSSIISGSIADESGFSEGDPLTVTSVDFSDDKDAVSVGIYTRKKKKGYLDISMRIGSQLDGPNYF